MSSDHIEIEGVIVSSTKGIFQVEIDQEQEDKKAMIILCTIAGKLRKNRIKLLIGDNVKVKVSPYDLSRGIIYFRNKKLRD